MTMNLTYATHVKIDWLTAHVTGEQANAWLTSSLHDFKPVKARWGYRRGLECAYTGLVIYVGRYEEPDDVLLVASGQVLDNLRVQWGVRGEPEFLVKLTSHTADATRVDIAVDVFDGGAGVDYLADAVENGGFSRRGRKEMVVSSPDAEHGMLRTVYAGRRPNRIVYRAYEKPVSGGGLRSRHEVEHHGDAAHALWLELWSKDGQFIQQAGHRSLYEVIAEDSRHIIPDAGGWKFGPLPSVRRSPRMRRREWLERQVLPVLVADFLDAPDSEEAHIEWLVREVAARSLDASGQEE